MSDETGRDWLASEGEAARAIRSRDWEGSALGARRLWPEPLRAFVHLLLDADEPMLCVWGEARSTLANDAARALAADDVPAQGAPLAAAWPGCAAAVEAVLRAKGAAAPTGPEPPAAEPASARHAPAGRCAAIRDAGGRVAGALCRLAPPARAPARAPTRTSSFERFAAALDGRVDGLAGTDDVERVAKELLALGTEAAGIGLFAIDLGTGTVILSPEAAAHAGAPGVSSMPIASLFASMHPDDVAMARERLRGAVDPEGDGALRLEHRVVLPGGEVRWVSVVGRVHVEGRGGARRAIRVVGATQDITEHRRLRERLVENEVRLRERVMDGSRELESMLDAAVSAIITIDEAGRVRSVNAATGTLFGYAREELLGRNVDVLMPEEHRVRHDGYLRAYITSGEARIIGIGRELEGRRKDGTTFPMHLSVGEFVAGGQRFFIGIIHDLTERHRAEQALRQAQKMEAIGQLSGGIAHDFNNLLTVVGGNLELLEMRLDAAAGTERELVAEAREAAARGAALTARLLAFARREPLDPETVEPARLVAGLMQLLRRTLGESITVRTAIDPHAWPVRVDRGQLESAIVNLSINARDAMPDGGTLVLDLANVTLEEARGVAGSALPIAEHVRLSVTDEGHGMTPEVMARVFEPFFTTKEVGRGTGLGLSTVFGFARRSGGHVDVASEPGVGTTFELYLPRCEAGPDAGAEANGDASTLLPDTRGEPILVVEDDPQVRRLTAGRLRLLGHDVVEAADGPRALAALEARPDIRLVFSDVVMPGGMSGHDVAREVRRRRPDVAVLLTSGYVGTAGDADAVAGEALLAKPYDQAALARALAAALVATPSTVPDPASTDGTAP